MINLTKLLCRCKLP